MPSSPDRARRRPARLLAASAGRLVLVAALGACASPTPTPDSIDSGADTAADAAPTSEVSEDIPTVVTVRWETAAPSVGVVEYGETIEYGSTASATASTTDHEVVLLGLPADSDVHFRTTSTTAAGDVVVSADQVAHTGSLAGGLPSFTFTGDPDAVSGFQLLTTIGAVAAVAIVDAQGQPVWAYVPADQDVGIFRARLAVDGQSVLYLSIPKSPDGGGEAIVRVSFDGGQIDSLAFDGLDHDFAELADGTIAAIATSPRTVDGVEIVGERIVEIDPDGDAVVVWDAWDSFDPAVTPGNGQTDRWVHANALDYQPERDAYTLSLRAFDSLVRIDRATGSITWALGAAVVDLPGAAAFSEDSTPFVGQHQFEWLDDGLLVFDNGAEGDLDSRVVEYALDADQQVATEVWSHHHDPALYGYALGDAHRGSDGLTQIVWSTAGVIEDVDPDGTAVWQLAAELGTGFGYSDRLASLYPLPPA